MVVLIIIGYFGDSCDNKELNTKIETKTESVNVDSNNKKIVKVVKKNNDIKNSELTNNEAESNVDDLKNDIQETTHDNDLIKTDIDKENNDIINKEEFDIYFIHPESLLKVIEKDVAKSLYDPNLVILKLYVTENIVDVKINDHEVIDIANTKAGGEIQTFEIPNIDIEIWSKNLINKFPFLTNKEDLEENKIIKLEYRKLGTKTFLTSYYYLKILKND